MACDFVVLVRDADQRIGHRAVADVVLDALESVDAMEQRLTVYDPQSEVSQINRAAGKGPVSVSIETFAVLQHAVRLSQLTSGAFDITAGPLIDAWGFTLRQGRKPTLEEIASARALVGMDRLRLNSEQRAVELLEPSMRINLGAIGKGDAIDCLADQLKSAGIQDFLIHAGQSSVLACGDQFDRAEIELSENSAPHNDAQQQEPPRGWKVGIAHPTKPNRRIAGIWLHDAALATSGSGKQFFHHRGKRYGHVIDPRTGEPAGDMLSLSVITPQAVDADALATGLFVNGCDAARAFGEANGPIPLVMVVAGTRQDSVDVQTVGHFDWVDPPQGTQQ
ncbi:Thiamine biosynthesis lipoprotein ApbE precursor [Allorhodopirellula heiligendammensis]|uniref:FAD:protein FMN transferase n=2 Tax=Allorhodopirellula heiligendammensis TaxID=2714739 RepID=A0A5C6BSN1_9BACT|nr:Thiamine biosynthesis lipoprotein ApbE precursor [Allorhodopirellula heiligendammensis]|tara:strand:- start:546 stop:1553 length:1008 start_codon:yes stop_codon:yes gene_type:complete